MRDGTDARKIRRKRGAGPIASDTCPRNELKAAEDRQTETRRTMVRAGTIVAANQRSCGSTTSWEMAPAMLSSFQWRAAGGQSRFTWFRLASCTLQYFAIDGRDEVDPDDGDVTKTHKVGHPIRSQPAIEGGRIYVGTHDGKVVCINTGDARFTGWPTWGANMAHTNIAE